MIGDWASRAIVQRLNRLGALVVSFGGAPWSKVAWCSMVAVGSPAQARASPARAELPVP